VSWSLAILGLVNKNEALLQTLWKQAIATPPQNFTSEALQVRKRGHTRKPLTQNF